MHTYILGAGRREPPLPCAEGADSASARRDVREMTVTGRQTGRGSLVGERDWTHGCRGGVSPRCPILLTARSLSEDTDWCDQSGMCVGEMNVTCCGR